VKARNLVILWIMVAGGSAQAASSFELDSVQAKHHVTADRTLLHSNEKIYEAFGHVVVSSEGKRLSADYLWVDDKTKEMRARGNVVFVDRQSTIEAAEIHFNLDTGLGSIFYGKVYNDLYTLKGQLIRRVGEARFLTTEGEYTTCKDCAESWKLSARHVDLTVDGYAFMDNVHLKIKDVPTLYFPYMILPVKTRRQTGLLFPRIGGSIGGGGNGFAFVQPFFLAIDEHQDATIAAGRYSARGPRYEGEYRYKSYRGIEGTVNYYRTEDRSFRYRTHRSAIHTTHEWPFAERFKMRWRLFDVSDREYLRDLSGDLPIEQSLPAMESNAVANSHFPDFFVSAEVRRYRNLLYSEPVGFDEDTVQTMPTVHFGLRERKLIGPLLGSVYGRFDHFTRGNLSFEDRNGNGIFDPMGNNSPNPEEGEVLREANRYRISPSISAPFRVGRYLLLNPYAQYHEIRYSFALPTASQPLASTSTRYVQLGLEASTVLEKVYDYDGETVSKVKHQIIPFTTFSNIPWINQNATHPFQVQLRRREDGLFDQFDVVPLTNSTEFLRYPLGKSIYYGFTSRLIRKMKTPEEMPREYPFDLLPATAPKKYPPPENRKQELAIEKMKLWDQYGPNYSQYEEIWTVNVSQAYDFKDAGQYRDHSGKPDRKRAFSYLLGTSDFSISNFSHYLEYYFYPRIVVKPTAADPNPPVLKSKHYLSTSLTWEFARMKGVQATGVRSFSRAVSANFTITNPPSRSRTVGGSLNWSFNDLMRVALRYDYDLLAKNQKSWSAVSTFAHYSECWGVEVRYDWARDRAPKHGEAAFQVLFNPMGTGFTGSNSFQQGGPMGSLGGI
jgi:lipopolysaccharide assembly outer membrane protein LptD (OstA)